MEEIHEGVFGSHSGARTIAGKVLQTGYYWPTIQNDCTKFVQSVLSAKSSVVYLTKNLRIFTLFSSHGHL